MPTDLFASIVASWGRVFVGVGTIEQRKSVFEHAVNDIAGRVGDYLDRSTAAGALHNLAEAHGLIEAYGEDEIQRIIAEGFVRTRANGQAKEGVIQWVDMSDWDEEPVPIRRWTIPNRVPLHQAGLFSGEGGVGKSIIELMKCVAHVAGKDWLGSMPEPGPAFYIGAEDDVEEIHIRLAAIVAHYGVTFKQLIEGGFHVLCLMGQDATLCVANGKAGRVVTTKLFKLLYEAAGDIKPKNISIDPLSRAFYGNEIDRMQAYGFVGHMQALAKVANGSVTVLGHPSMAGIASGSGISGSTGWHGAFRFRQYLKSAEQEEGEERTGLRELEFKKNQYGPPEETIVLKYERGLFLPVGGASSLERAAFEAKAEHEFLMSLAKFMNQGRNVSDKRTSHNYAPAAFTTAEFGIKDMAQAMERLFESGKIRVEDYGRASKGTQRIVPV